MSVSVARARENFSPQTNSDSRLFPVLPSEGVDNARSATVDAKTEIAVGGIGPQNYSVHPFSPVHSFVPGGIGAMIRPASAGGFLLLKARDRSVSGLCVEG